MFQQDAFSLPGKLKLASVEMCPLHYNQMDTKEDPMNSLHCCLCFYKHHRPGLHATHIIHCSLQAWRMSRTSILCQFLAVHQALSGQRSSSMPNVHASLAFTSIHPECLSMNVLQDPTNACQSLGTMCTCRCAPITISDKHARGRRLQYR